MGKRNNYILETENLLIRVSNKARHTNANKSIAGQGKILSLLYENKQLTISEISKQMGIRSSSTCEMVRTLVDKGFIIKSKCVEDMRKNVIALSEIGTTYYQKNILLSNNSTSFLDCLTTKEIADLNSILEKIDGYID